MKSPFSRNTGSGKPRARVRAICSTPLTVLAVLIASLGAISPALAQADEAGSLIQIGCLFDPISGETIEGCTSVGGLGGANSVTASPNGKYVYAAAYDRNTLTAYKVQASASSIATAAPNSDVHAYGTSVGGGKCFLLPISVNTIHCDSGVIEVDAVWDISEFVDKLNRTGGYIKMEVKQWQGKAPACTRDDTVGWTDMGKSTVVTSTHFKVNGIYQGVIFRAIETESTGTSCAMGYVKWLGRVV